MILALIGLRSDLHLKIKEIKNLSGDFKNSVDKEMDATRRAVNNLQEILGQSELDSSLTVGRQDPYLLRLAVDRQLERQLDEENYLHQVGQIRFFVRDIADFSGQELTEELQAYLNLESSGRELESIVVGEIQKSYNALSSILKRDADSSYNTIDKLMLGPISMAKDHEWSAFISRDGQFVDPKAPIRSAEHINYPGRDHHACQEIRAGLLERKSKYLKSYAAGWCVCTFVEPSAGRFYPCIATNVTGLGMSCRQLTSTSSSRRTKLGSLSCHCISPNNDSVPTRPRARPATSSSLRADKPAPCTADTRGFSVRRATTR